MVLARLRPEYAPPDRPPEVHAYRVDHVMWMAPCGDTVNPDEVEIVKPFTGTPCPRCWMLAALATDVPLVSRAELETTPPSPELPAVSPADVVVESSDAMLLYAPSWRERVVHYAHPKAPTQKYGRSGTVVAGLCGEIGWGPHTRPPVDWPMCSECVQIVSVGIS